MSRRSGCDTRHVTSLVNEHDGPDRPDRPVRTPDEHTAVGPTDGARGTAVSVALGVVCVTGLLLRVWPRGALWLDEAQSVAIARLPLTKIVGALREDGAPPLYYLILHAWMWLFGSGDVAVRSLTVVTSIGFLVAIVVAARRFAGERAAWCVLVLTASSSFAVRYASEARMYSLVMLEATLALLAVAAMLTAPTIRRGIAVAVLAATLPYTHYWGIYLVAAGGAVLAVAAARTADPDQRRAARKALLAVGGGVVLWLPWLPEFRYQSVHTATPWTEAAELSSIFDTTFRWNRTELAGGVLLAFTAAGVILALVLGHQTWRAVRVPRWAIAATAVGSLVLAVVGGTLSGSAYVGRYSAVAFPFAVLLAGVGIASIRPRRLIAVVLAAGWFLGVGYSLDEIRTPRTRASPIAAALLPRIRPGDVVVYCPDQLGPATSRLLDRSPTVQRVTQLVYPGGAGPERVDWVDYADRYREAVAAPFAVSVDARAAAATVWLIASTIYPATQEACQGLMTAMLRVRPQATRLLADDPKIADHGALWRFGPA
ncbi:MAG: hypothetical protein JWM12_3908 [Ilumatobacteraceae bacterium]|nr:hypothetical protein [Ilumatobacteraceae bacterium]